jgi:hypothetical protein
MTAHAQEMPDVKCSVENYELAPGKPVQVVVLRDPSGEQEARFDLTHGASLTSLRYRGMELFYGHGAGANVEMYEIRRGTEQELKGLSPFWSAYNPEQGESSMDVPATVAGVACHGQASMDAFAMMVDGGADNSFQQHPLLGVWNGQLSGHFPPGYSAPYALETEARWVPNPSNSPKYYLQLNQTVVDVRGEDSGAMHWLLRGTVPWGFVHATGGPDRCTIDSPCDSRTTRALAAGRYQDAAHSNGVAVVVPTQAWATDRLYLAGSANPEAAAPDGKAPEGKAGAPQRNPEVAVSSEEAPDKRYFGIVLAHSLAGATGFQFTWYVCAGPWDGARTFATTVGR